MLLIANQTIDGIYVLMHACMYVCMCVGRYVGMYVCRKWDDFNTIIQLLSFKDET